MYKRNSLNGTKVNQIRVHLFDSPTTREIMGECQI